jgi:hypothetical protein
VKGFVYAAPLFQALTVDLFGALGTGKIDEVKVTDLCIDYSVHHVF